MCKHSSSNIQFPLTKYTMFEQAFLLFKLFHVVCKDLWCICEIHTYYSYSELSLVTFEPPSNTKVRLYRCTFMCHWFDVMLLTSAVQSVLEELLSHRYCVFSNTLVLYGTPPPPPPQERPNAVGVCLAFCHTNSIPIMEV